MDKYHQLARIAVKAECDECYLTALQFWQKAIKTKEGILHKEWVNKRELLSNVVYEAIRQRSDLTLHLPPARRL